MHPVVAWNTLMLALSPLASNAGGAICARLKVPSFVSSPGHSSQREQLPLRHFGAFLAQRLQLRHRLVHD